jgi:ferrochelatase
MGRPTGIVVAQLGGPRDEREVEPFIRAIFADPDLVPIPGGPRVSAVFGWVVAKLRGPFVRKNYRGIGGGSPIREITAAQARALERTLVGRGHDVQTAVAMRYTRPDTHDAVRELMRAGVERLVFLALYPQYSLATTQSSIDRLQRVIDELDAGVEPVIIRSWHDHPAYIALQARLVDEALERHLPESERDGAAVVFSAHGLPERVVAKGDPYPEETAATVAAVMEAMSYQVDGRIAYQSRTRPVRWIGPGTEDVLDALGEEGWTSVCVVPISFVSDHIETLYEVDELYREHARKAGINHYFRSEVMNDRPEVGPLLADVVEEHL